MRDWSNPAKGLGNPDWYLGAPANRRDEASLTSVGLLVPNMHNYLDALFKLMIGSMAPIEWLIMHPKDKSFADLETDQDILLLRGLVFCTSHFICMIVLLIILLPKCQVPSSAASVAQGSNWKQ